MKLSQDIIIKPIITEKSMDMLADKRYVFKVADDATKPEIAAAIEEMFDVEVASVNTISMKKKPKRLGVHAGFTGEWKKAIVTLKPSSKTIAFFDSMN
ncbi:MAG: 50S ribosomal protein L23 [Clostridia bacterium]|nr:50S ribosomal protein L23 [Clostridia bacterium]